MIERVKNSMRAYECEMEASFSDDMLLGLAQRLAKGTPILQRIADEIGPEKLNRLVVTTQAMEQQNQAAAKAAT